MAEFKPFALHVSALKNKQTLCTYPNLGNSRHPSVHPPQQETEEKIGIIYSIV